MAFIPPQNKNDPSETFPTFCGVSSSTISFVYDNSSARAPPIITKLPGLEPADAFMSLHLKINTEYSLENLSNPLWSLIIHNLVCWRYFFSQRTAKANIISAQPPCMYVRKMVKLPKPKLPGLEPTMAFMSHLLKINTESSFRILFNPSWSLLLHNLFCPRCFFSQRTAKCCQASLFEADHDIYASYVNNKKRMILQYFFQPIVETSSPQFVLSTSFLQPENRQS